MSGDSSCSTAAPATCRHRQGARFEAQYLLGSEAEELCLAATSAAAAAAAVVAVVEAGQRHHPRDCCHWA